MTERRIGVANLVLETFTQGVILYQERELRMCWDVRRPIAQRDGMYGPRHDYPARLKEQGIGAQFRYRPLPIDGTGMQALAQLIRYVRDLPRLPLITWEYWGSEKIRLCTPRTIELLRKGGYGDPLKTGCVFCGDQQFQSGLDWCSREEVTGPSCYGGMCREQQKKSA